MGGRQYQLEGRMYAGADGINATTDGYPTGKIVCVIVPDGVTWTYEAGVAGNPLNLQSRLDGKPRLLGRGGRSTRRASIAGYTELNAGRDSASAHFELGRALSAPGLIKQQKGGLVVTHGAANSEYDKAAQHLELAIALAPSKAEYKAHARRPLRTPLLRRHWQARAFLNRTWTLAQTQRYVGSKPRRRTHLTRGACKLLSLGRPNKEAVKSIQAALVLSHATAPGQPPSRSRAGLLDKLKQYETARRPIPSSSLSAVQFSLAA
ncbi:MAG TPA: hypothetical protein VER03_04965 [Bryobacteraceae bacterium]|nr:hypothetical protein [Bryobacteraceae bacterium]